MFHAIKDTIKIDAHNFAPTVIALVYKRCDVSKDASVVVSDV